MGLFSKEKLKKVQTETKEAKEAVKGYTLLLVDDEPSNLSALARILDKDYQILTANDGQEALEVVKQRAASEPIHLIVSDQRMPKLTGVEFLKETIPITPKTIRIILTGFTDIDAIISSINEGQIYKFITKPIEPQDLLLTIQRALETYELEAKNVLLLEQLKASNEQLANYNRTLELKVEERTQALQTANTELQATLEHLKATQQELIQAEKMAALGHLIAGIAHEINTPLGAIRSSIENISHSLQGDFVQRLTKIFYAFSQEQQNIFNLLLKRIQEQEEHLTSREKRQFKRALMTQLKESGLAETDDIADLLVEIGIYQHVDTFLPLLKSAKEQDTLGFIYQLADLYKSIYTITMATNRAAKVVFALKNFVHFGSSETKITVDVTEGIETVLILYYHQLKQGVEVVKHYASLPQLACYPDELNQVWTNLIHNALQAMDNRGTLQIETALRDQAIAISVTDSGKGIPPEIKHRIFEPFFTTKPAGEGSGLGLDIVCKIIAKHDGQIEVESVPGKTTFTILLPITKSE